MENVKIRKYFERKSEDVQEILIKIVEDSLLCLYNQSVIKDKTPKIVSDIKEKVSNSTNKVEIVTEQMEVDMEEGVMNEYYNRF